MNYIFQQMQNKKDNMLFIQIYDSTPMTLFVKKNRKHKPKKEKKNYQVITHQKKKKNNNKAIINGGYQNPNILQTS